MRIDIADAAPGERFDFDDAKHLVIRGDFGFRQLHKMTEDFPAIDQSAQRQLPDNERMAAYAALLQQPHQGRVAAAEMVDPDRCVGKDHGSSLRRGISCTSGSLPPNRARRRALSRSMGALSASRIVADFSVRPVKA
jgi:hypothetical protein